MTFMRLWMRSWMTSGWRDAFEAPFLAIRRSVGRHSHTHARIRSQKRQCKREQSSDGKHNFFASWCQAVLLHAWSTSQKKVVCTSRGGRHTSMHFWNAFCPRGRFSLFSNWQASIIVLDLRSLLFWSTIVFDPLKVFGWWFVSFFSVWMVTREVLKTRARHWTKVRRIPVLLQVVNLTLWHLVLFDQQELCHICSSEK